MRKDPDVGTVQTPAHVISMHLHLYTRWIDFQGDVEMKGRGAPESSDRGKVERRCEITFSSLQL